jgi:hypothetical protein
MTTEESRKVRDVLRALDGITPELMAEARAVLWPWWLSFEYGEDSIYRAEALKLVNKFEALVGEDEFEEIYCEEKKRFESYHDGSCLYDGCSCHTAWCVAQEENDDRKNC